MLLLSVHYSLSKKLGDAYALKASMKQEYWLCKRNNVFFAFDSDTDRRESLRTSGREEAKRIVRAKNDANTQTSINISIARAYLRLLSEIIERFLNGS